MANSEDLVEDSLIKELFTEVWEEIRDTAALISNSPGTSNSRKPLSALARGRRGEELVEEL